MEFGSRRDNFLAQINFTLAPARSLTRSRLNKGGGGEWRGGGCLFGPLRSLDRPPSLLWVSAIFQSWDSCGGRGGPTWRHQGRTDGQASFWSFNLDLTEKWIWASGHARPISGQPVRRTALLPPCLYAARSLCYATCRQVFGAVVQLA